MADKMEMNDYDVDVSAIKVGDWIEFRDEKCAVEVDGGWELRNGTGLVTLIQADHWHIRKFTVSGLAGFVWGTDIVATQEGDR